MRPAPARHRPARGHPELQPCSFEQPAERRRRGWCTAIYASDAPLDRIVSLPCCTLIACVITPETQGAWREITSKTASRTLLPFAVLGRRVGPAEPSGDGRANEAPTRFPNPNHVRHCDIRGR